MFQLLRTWQKPKNTNHGSTYSILDALAGRYDLRHVVRRTPTVEAIAEVDEERIALEISAKKKETSPRFGDETVNRADPGVHWGRCDGTGPIGPVASLCRSCGLLHVVFV